MRIKYLLETFQANDNLDMTRKYPLRRYILGPPGWPESIFSAGLGLTFFHTVTLERLAHNCLGAGREVPV